MDTLSDTENASQPANEESRSRGWLKSLVVVIAILAIDRAIVLPYFVFGPGEAAPTSTLIDIAADKRFPSEGEVLLTTITLTEAHPSDIFWAWLKPSEVIEKKQKTLQGLTTEEYLELNDNMVDSSKLAAVSVALGRAGYPVTFAGEGAQVSEVQAGSPSEGVLRKADILVAVNGEPVTTAQEATSAIRAYPSGTPINAEVVASDGTKRTETITTGRREDGTSFLGLLISTKDPRVDSPFLVQIQDTPFGGPSAGLAFTLSLLDNLTPGELTGGKTVAATGTIESDGRVGPVGGVEQKTHTINDSDAKLFLVPSMEFEEAERIADDDVKVVAVDTLDQALEALRIYGGEPPQPVV